MVGRRQPFPWRRRRLSSRHTAGNLGSGCCPAPGWGSRPAVQIRIYDAVWGV